MVAALSIDLRAVTEAAQRIAGHVVRTPTLHSETLSDIVGCNVWLKFENLQFTASFKERGALNKLLQLDPDERRRGVVAMSAGNHAQGVAHHARRLAIPATIVMPEFTPHVKVRNTEALGATVVLHGASLREARQRALELADAAGLVWVHPYDDSAVMAGQGTVALELLEDAPALSAIVVPVGGGGLLSGMAVVCRALSPTTELLGVQSELFPSAVAALHGEVAVCGGPTIAEGIAVADVGLLTMPVINELVDDVVTVSEARIEQAVNLLLDIEKTVVEGAGAAGLAAVLDRPAHFAGRAVGLVLCGGNIDPRLLAQVIMRGLVRAGRLTRIRVDLTDAPGALARVSAIIAALGGNIVEVSHQRMFSVLSARAVVLEVTVETRDAGQATAILESLRASGHHVEVG
ncbi:MAG: ilvA [Acidimicrobiia bacterium]|nr:ilvA [Acidimicrobiia bacterium]